MLRLLGRVLEGVAIEAGAEIARRGIRHITRARGWDGEDEPAAKQEEIDMNPEFRLSEGGALIVRAPDGSTIQISVVGGQLVVTPKYKAEASQPTKRVQREDSDLLCQRCAICGGNRDTCGHPPGAL